MAENIEGQEYWWTFLKNVLQRLYRQDLPLTTVTGVRNKILEIGEDFFVVKSEKGRLDRPITKQRVEYVLRIVIEKGYYDSVSANQYPELMDFKDKSGLKGAHTAIVRGLLVHLPFIKKEGRARIVFSPSDYDKDKWGIKG